MANWDDRQRCGYGLCSCVGVQFISSGMGSTDYCVDGKRERVPYGSPVSWRVFLYSLDKYADFLKWHAKQRAAGVILDRDPAPFSETLRA